MSLRTKSAAVALTAALTVPGAVGVAASANAASPGQGVAGSVQAATTGTMYTTKATNVRKGPGTKYAVIDSLPKNAKVRVTTTAKGYSSDKGATVSWSKLSSGGWVRSDLLTSTAPKVSGGAYGSYYISKTTNLRSGPGTKYKVIKSLPQGTTVKVVDKANGWSNDAQDDVLWFKLSIGGWVNALNVGTRT